MPLENLSMDTRSPFSGDFRHLAGSTPPLGGEGDRFQITIEGSLPHFQGLSYASAVSRPQLSYLDFAASTPPCDEALTESLVWQTHLFGNPANRLHGYGELSEHGLWEARQSIAEDFGASAEEIIFTSSATEAANLVLRGLAFHPKRKRCKIVVSPTEHSCILETARTLEKMKLAPAVHVEWLRVNEHGQVDLEHAASLIDDQTLIVCVMDINNETGVRQNQLFEICEIAHRNGACVYSDTVQGFLREGVHVQRCPIDFAVCSGSKIYGLKGAAALFLRRHTPLPDGHEIPRAMRHLQPQMTGGGQEFGLRSSTPNLPAIRALAKAAQLVTKKSHLIAAHFAHLDQIFLSHLNPRLETKVYGGPHRSAGILMLSFAGVNAMKLLENCPELALSAGSACRTLQATASPVLLAMGTPLEEALGSFRISFGLVTSPLEAQRAAEILSERALSSRP